MQKYILPISILPIALIISVFFNISTTSAQEANIEVPTETHIIGNVPTDFETAATLEWTGGTLYQLKARLQTLGCHADQIMIYNEEQRVWFLYSQYSWPLSFNKEFHKNYPEDYIPASTIHIPSCYDMCEFQYTDRVLDELEKVDGEDFVEDIKYWPKCITTENNVYDIAELKGLECTQDWDPRVKEHVLPIMPVMKDLCIFRTHIDIYRIGGYVGMNYYGSYNNIWVSIYKPFVAIYKNQDEISFFAELHEICHSQQEWYVAQFMSPYELYTEDKIGLWYNTPAGQWLINRAQFDVTLDNNIDYWIPPNWDLPKWALKSDGLYHSLYSPNPEELGAELCAIKLFSDITGEKNTRYNNESYLLEVLEDSTTWLDEYIFILEE